MKSLRAFRGTGKLETQELKFLETEYREPILKYFRISSANPFHFAYTHEMEASLMPGWRNW